MDIFITGGAGFVGSALARHFKTKFPKNRIVAFDNLKRRGSERNVQELQSRGVEFIHGDIRNPGDFSDLGNFDLFLECSAEPSVLAGLNGSPRYVIDTNLSGTINCLEFAREHAKKFIFLSTSRVYSINPLKEIALRETDSRFEIAEKQNLPGISAKGISEDFPTHLARSLYGATKLGSELLVQEYAANFGLDAIIDRFGVICGPGQFGKADQGVFTLWVARHFFNIPLTYTGFGGTGKQVRDLLHIKDLVSFIDIQAGHKEKGNAEIYNMGGGYGCSTSLKELTLLSQNATGNKVAIGSKPDSASVDIPLYISDYARAEKKFGFRPKCTVKDIVADLVAWFKTDGETLLPLFK